MALITSTDTANQPANGSTVAAFSDGTWLALSEQSGTIHYHTSSDGGATWTDRGALPGSWSGLSVVIWAGVQTRGGTEYLIVWSTNGTTSTLISAAIPWTSGTLGTAVTGTYDVAGWRNPAAAMVWDAGHGVFHVLIDAAPALYVAAVDVNLPGATLITTSAQVSLYLTTTSARDIAVSGASVLITLSDGYRGQIDLLPIAYISGSYSINPAALEQVATGTGAHHITVDNDGKAVLCYVDAGSTLQYCRRTGSLTYTTPRALGSVSPTQSVFTVAHDAGTDDLWVAWTTAASETNGEIMAARRTGGNWQAVVTFAGGDASGYQWPRLSLAASSSAFGLTWLKGTGTTRELDFGAASPAAAPSKPTNLTSGSVAGLAPTLHADYLNTAVSDPQKYAQRQLYDATGVTLILDTGQVATTSPDWAYPGTPALVYDTNYQWRARYWDSLSAGGSGTASTWSDFATITPRRAGTVTGVDVRNAGVVSTTTITGTSITADFTWNQTDSHDASAYQLILTQADGVTAICQTAVTTLSPVLASGGSFTTAAFALTGITNGESVCLVVAVTDATSGLVTKSAPLALTIAFAPPPAPTGFLATPDDLTGIVTLTWTNPSEAVAVEVQYKRSADAAWTEYSSGTLIATVPFPANTTLAYDYRVRVIDDRGVPSDWATVVNVTLDMQAGVFGVWLYDLDDTSQSAAIGAADDLSVFELDNMEDEKGFVPMGRSTWVSSFGPTDYDEGTQFKVFIPGSQPDGHGGTIDGNATKDTLKAMKHHRLLYTEPNGTREYVRLTAFKRAPVGGGHWYVMFTLRQTEAPADALL